MTLTEIRRWLDERDIRLTKSLGQNFLHDGNQLRRIAAAGQLAAGDQVLEIGPGFGPLTELLVASGAEIMAVEMDPRLVEVLRERFPPPTPLTLVHADALRWLRKNPRDWSGWKLVANPPYSVASPVLVELAASDGPPERLVSTLQLEVVRRIVAKPDTDDYGILTLLLQLRYQPREWFRIRASCFFPEPSVDSGCVTLIRRPRPLLSIAEAATFTRLVKLAFSQRRKMMFKLLKGAWPEEALAAAFSATGITRTERAERVPLEGFVALTKHLHVP